MQSIPGEGATFTLYLPKTGTANIAAESPSSEIVDGTGFYVLLVEDNREVRDFAADALKTLGYDCIVAPDGEAALKELETDSSRFDVVFSDVVMPGISGVELGERVRSLYPDMPIILASGYSHVLAENGRHGFELLHKPYSIQQLSRVIRKALVWRAPRNALGSLIAT